MGKLFSIFHTNFKSFLSICLNSCIITSPSLYSLKIIRKPEVFYRKRSVAWQGLITDILIYWSHPANIYLYKINNKNTRIKFEICLKLTIKTPERRQLRRSGVFIVNFEHISHISHVSIVEFEQVNVSRVTTPRSKRPEVFHRLTVSKITKNFQKTTQIVTLVSKATTTNLLKKGDIAGVSLYILQTFLEQLFHRTPSDDCSYSPRNI